MSSLQYCSLILHKRSSEPGKIPALSSMELGEIGINTHDCLLFFKSDDNVIESISVNSKTPYSFNLELSSFQFQLGNNVVSGIHSAVLGGKSNTISHANSFAIGSNLTSHADNFTYVNNISANLYWGDGQHLTGISKFTTVPTTSSSQGNPGQIAADDEYMYVCTQTNTWKRAALAAW